MFEFIAGMVAIIAFGCFRAVRSDGWDDSNILNWLRLCSMVYIHPEEFTELYSLSEAEIDVLKLAGYDPVEPFAFIRMDEFAENFPNTRR
jgi:hypothetical protein